MDTERTTQIAARIPEKLRDQVVMVANRERRSITEIIIFALETYVEKKK